VDCSTPENLKRFLITSRLVHPEKWEQVLLEVGSSATADQIMQTTNQIK